MEKVDIQGGNATSPLIVFIFFKRQNLILKRDHPYSLPVLDGNERLMHQGKAVRSIHGDKDGHPGENQ